MKRSTRKLLQFFKTIVSGIIGAVLLLILGLLLFAIVKVIYLVQQNNLLLSPYTIGIILFIFVIIGFVWGVTSFLKKNSLYKIFRWTSARFWIAAMLALLFTIIAYFIAKGTYAITLGFWQFVIMLIILYFLCYGFSAVAVHIYTAYPFTHMARRKTTFKDWLFLVLFNPIFILLYLWLFSIVAYNSMYVPCGVSIVGVDRNVNTINTASLDIVAGQKLISIDNVPIHSLQDVRDYMNSLTTTKEVIVETPSTFYYVKTYEEGSRRYMGLVLTEDICKRTN